MSNRDPQSRGSGPEAPEASVRGAGRESMTEDDTSTAVCFDLVCAFEAVWGRAQA